MATRYEDSKSKSRDTKTVAYEHPGAQEAPRAVQRAVAHDAAVACEESRGARGGGAGLFGGVERVEADKEG